MSATSTEAKKVVYCRFCGHLDNMTYCSKCGLELNVDAEAPWKFFVSRFSFLVQPIFRFLCTFLFLLAYPRTFFLALEKDGYAVDVAQIIFSKRRIEFSPWRRPMAPASYLLSLSIMMILLFRFSELDVPMYEKIGGILPGFTRDFLVDGVEISGGFAIELVLVIFLFLMMVIYRFLLGVSKDYSKNFFEFFFYSSIQYLLCIGVISAIPLFLDDDGFLIFLVLVSAVLFSVYYYFFVPIRIFPARYGVNKLRVIAVYIAMSIVAPILVALVLLVVMFLVAIVIEIIDASST